MLTKRVYISRSQVKIALLFIAVLFFAFLPISSFIFYIKNDAFTNYFPPKFFMSESIHAGYLPLWNPYINYGIPQYADMNAGYWSPITWLIASTVGYNAYTFTLETLFYLLAGGLGMYKLTGLGRFDKRVRILAGIGFMCCGFNVGHMQHFNWLSGAAFLPWCIWCYYLLQKKSSGRHIVTTAFLFYLFIASAHPGMIIGAFYFFAAVFVYIFFRNEKHEGIAIRLKRTGRTHFFFFLLLLLFGAGIISGYLDILPYFFRAEKISLAESLGNPANMQTWISALLPFATVKNDAFFNTDPSIRNSYFSLTLLIFFLVACFRRKTPWQKFLLVMGISFALLSSGGIFKTIAYHILPMTGYVRLNGEFRIFALLCFILIAALELNRYITAEEKPRQIKWVLYTLGILLTGCVFYGLIQSFSTKDSILYYPYPAQLSLTEKLKFGVDHISFYDTFWIQGIIQLGFLYGTGMSLKKERYQLLLILTVINMSITTLMNIPFTGAGKASVTAVQSVLNKSPKGIPVPALQPVMNNDTLHPGERQLIGDWSFYSKQIGNLTEFPYPIVLNNMRAYYQDASRLYFSKKPFLFLETNEPGTLLINEFTAAKLIVSIETTGPTSLIMKQNHYPHWFYDNGTNKGAVRKEGINFMSIPVEKGKSIITISFEPAFIKWMMLLSIISMLVALLYLLKNPK